MKLHIDIVSTEIIKPSSLTPLHLKTYNLMFLDQVLGIESFIPLVFFYPKTNDHSFHDKTLEAKKSLSQILTKYYPFAGRLAKAGAAHVECNDEGVEFHVGYTETTLSDFLQNSQNEDLDQLFPYGQVWGRSNRRSQSNQVIPLAIQINCFKCEGMAVAISMFHKIADASSTLHFVNDWAKMTQVCSKRQEHIEPPSDPKFISYPYRNINNKEVQIDAEGCVTRSFVFPNSKINELKLKVKAESGQAIMNPTRVDVVTWLLYKCMVEATTKNNPGTFVPNTFVCAVNIRNKMMEPLPEKTIGNYLSPIMFPIKKETEMKPKSFIGELQKQKENFRGVRNIEAAFGLVPNMSREKDHIFYNFSSFCRYPSYEADFGWGKPVKVTIGGNLLRNNIFLMDAPNGDGIEAFVTLDKKEMAIFQSHPELLAFC